MEMMMDVNGELKKIVSRMKARQDQLQAAFKQRAWMDDARKFAEKQGKEVRKLIATDVDKVRSFIEKERKELEKFQKQLPGEVKKFKKFVDGQKKELEKLLANVRKAGVRVELKGKRSGKKKSTGGTKKKAAASGSTKSQAGASQA